MKTTQTHESIIQEVRDNWNLKQSVDTAYLQDDNIEEEPYIVMLMGDVEEDVMSNIISEILEIDMKNQKLNTKNPIHLYVSTYGGSTYDCFALCDIISTIDTPVYTFALGKVMSAGLPILSVGDYRYTFPNTSFLYHEVQSEFCGSVKDMKTHTQEVRNLMRIYDTILLDNTCLIQDTLDSFKNGNEIYFDAKDMLLMGFVDEIL